jgi:hypothetical protein
MPSPSRFIDVQTRLTNALEVHDKLIREGADGSAIAQAEHQIYLTSKALPEK